MRRSHAVTVGCPLQQGIACESGEAKVMLPWMSAEVLHKSCLIIAGPQGGRGLYQDRETGVSQLVKGSTMHPQAVAGWPEDDISGNLQIVEPSRSVTRFVWGQAAVLELRD